MADSIKMTLGNFVVTGEYEPDDHDGSVYVTLRNGSRTNRIAFVRTNTLTETIDAALHARLVIDRYGVTLQKVRDHDREWVPLMFGPDWTL